MKKNNQNKKEELIILKKLIVKRSTPLLEFLISNLNDSRNNIKMLLKTKRILVNGTPVTQFDYPLSKEDEIKISKNPVQVAENKKSPSKKERLPKIEIIYEDEYFIAVNKPQGILSVESDKERLSVYSLLEQYMTSIDKRNRPFIIHRIDKETSGVLVFAKNEKIHTILRLNWNDYVVRREYVAIIDGHMKNNEGTLKNYLKENQNHLVYVSNEGDLAITNYKVKFKSNEYEYLNINIDTGRKNQIRVQLNHLGTPIIGDDKYGEPKNPLKRLGLHANKLILKNPLTNEEVTFEAKIPAIFTSLFNK
jgi:23S rRNA pseudouridine1911/1915/1917 synthase